MQLAHSPLGLSQRTADSFFFNFPRRWQSVWQKQAANNWRTDRKPLFPFLSPARNSPFFVRGMRALVHRGMKHAYIYKKCNTGSAMLLIFSQRVVCEPLRVPHFLRHQTPAAEKLRALSLEFALPAAECVWNSLMGL